MVLKQMGSIVKIFFLIAFLFITNTSFCCGDESIPAFTESSESSSPVKATGKWILDKERSYKTFTLGVYASDENDFEDAGTIGFNTVIGVPLKGQMLNAAVLRPEYAGVYQDIFDVVLMARYPVANKPLAWLSVGIDAVKSKTPDKEIWAVIQASGGREQGRAAEYKEIRALSYLAVIHGVRGLIFYDYKSMKEDKKHWNNMKLLVNELNAFGDVFLSDNSKEISYSPSDLSQTGFEGSPPVHARIFKTPDGKYYLVAVNILDKTVRGELTGLPGGIESHDEFFSDKRYAVINGSITDVFNPYDVKIYISGREYKSVTLFRDGKPLAGFYIEKAQNVFTGLMFRHALREDGGMIFEIDAGSLKGFWMMNMMFPIDLLFLNEEGRLVDFYQDVRPCKEGSPCAVFSSTSDYRYGGVRYAVELGAGSIKKYGIKKGDKFHID